jgi:hypothetical protein
MAGDLSIIIVILGMLYGFFNKGTENYLKILFKGLKIGLTIGIIIGIIAFLFSTLLGGIVAGLTGGFIAGFGGSILFIIIIGIITVEFIIGVFIGDILEKLLRR